MQRRGESGQLVKGRRTPPEAPIARVSITDLQEQIAALERELKEARDQQAATAEVLRVVSSSPADVQPAFEAMVARAARLCEAEFSAVTRFENGLLHLVAMNNLSPVEKETFHSLFPRPPERNFAMGRAFLDGISVHFEDVLADPSYDAHTREVLQRVLGYRSFLAVPIIRGGQPIGAIGCGRRQVRPFTATQIALVQTFADQALIAIENARLLGELRQSLRRQTATSDVLKVISRSTFDLQTVFETLITSAAQMCDAEIANIWRPNHGAYRMAAAYGVRSRFKEYLENKEYLETLSIEPGRGSIVGRTLLTGKMVHVCDIQADPEYQLAGIIALGGYRTALGVPLLREGEPIGVLFLARTNVEPFTQQQIDLVTTFADQAVIAIENVRLFEAEQQRTRELSESLQQQTATSEVLNVISSSPGQLEPVFDAMLVNAVRICAANFGMLFRIEGDTARAVAMVGVPPAFAEFWQRGAQRPGPRTALGRTIATRQTIHIVDVKTEPAFLEGEPVFVAAVNLGGFRTILNVPMLKDGEIVGTLAIYRQEVRSFTEKQIGLVQNFAAQAVIAIENARLLTELRESLAQQTATADVLKVISRSAFDLGPVLDALLESAARLCDADRAIIFKRDGDVYRLAAGYRTSREFEEFSSQNPIVPGRGTITGRAVLEGKTVHIPDVLADSEYTGTGYQTRGEYRSSLAVPLVREGETIGVFTLMRLAVRPYTQKQIELITTFADQAVIAIENVRLFEEVQARTRDLGQSVRELRALGEVTQAVNSTVDLETVLNTIVTKATQLSSTEAGAIYVFDDARQEFRLRATYGLDDTTVAELRHRHIGLGETALSDAVERRLPIQIPDIQDDPSAALDTIVRAGFRALLILPLLSPDKIVGALVVRRKKPGEFPKNTVELLQTFAAQSVLAIQNARLFEDVEARTRELAKSLEDLRTAQDRLVQTEKLASLGQLTAGIAHEIKNPLNFINNFSAVSAELVEELQEMLAGASLDPKLRGHIEELSGMLQKNLEKVVQHGKRADAIVKNMLLHSRAGSGERRSVDINAVVEEGLNLAYHGARAEKQGFNITIERFFDPTAGEVDLYPQEITRVLLNLISNGFYAATKRKTEANGDKYEPVLLAATKNLGDEVEIRIRDNGTGIPPEIKEKMFNPFFTTKPAGEGTGLGLSISHDIIVKQHAGRIEVDSQPGEFTEFRIILPRTAALLPQGGGRA